MSRPVATRKRHGGTRPGAGRPHSGFVTEVKLGVTAAQLEHVRAQGERSDAAGVRAILERDRLAAAASGA